MSLISKSQNSKQDRDSLKVFVIIAASGMGQRFDSDLPKQFCLFDGSTPVHKTIGLFLSLDFVAGVICVIPDGFQDRYDEISQAFVDPRLLPSVIGGENRSDSVRIGLNSIEKYSPDYVLIHDAARYFCPAKVVCNVFEKLKSGSIAVVPIVSPTDSVRFHGKALTDLKLSYPKRLKGFSSKRY